MATEREILKYEIDLTDVEAKAKRLLELKQKIDSTRGSGGDSGALEQELRETAQGLEGVARGGKRAGEELFDFERKGEKVVKGVLATMSPQLASAADMAIDLAEGFNKISPALLAVAGAGAALGVITVSMQAMAASAQAALEKLERLSEAQREMRDASVKSTADFADASLKLGLDPASGSAAMNSRMIDLMQGKRGMAEMPAAMAAEVAKAGVFAASRGIAFDDQQFAAGLSISGGVMPSTDTLGEYQAVLQRVLNAGNRPDARRVLDGYLDARLPATRRENAALPTGDVSPIAVDEDTILAEKVARGDITEAQAKRARAMLANPAMLQLARDRESVSPPIRWTMDLLGETSNDQRIALGVVEQVQNERQVRGASMGGAVTPHTTINITNNTYGTAHFGGGNALRNPNFDSPVHSPGGGLHRNGVE